MKNENKIIDFIKSLIPYVIIILIVVLIRTFVVTPGIVNGESMENTLFDGDFVLVNKIGLWFGIDRFDIVVVRHENDTIIKRVIGLPGETVKYADNVLYINNERIKTPLKFETNDDFTLIAGKNEYIVLGDNRNISKDSRIIGPVDKKSIKGKVNFVLFPFENMGKVN